MNSSALNQEVISLTQVNPNQSLQEFIDDLFDESDFDATEEEEIDDEDF